MGKQTTVLVTGITGQQGGAVARTLITKGYKVRGFTRNPDAPRAREMEKLGVSLVRGDFSDPASLHNALNGVDSVFAMSTFWEQGVEGEIRQGRALADAARSAGVSHFVFTSVVGAERNTGIPHFDSKGEVERHIVEIGLPYTFLRPVYFMENLYLPQTLEAIQQGQYPVAMPANRRLQQVAVEDIGRFGALVISRRDEFLSRAIDVASDDLTGADVSNHLSQALDRKIAYVELPMDAVRAMSEEMATMYQWFNDVGYDVDVNALRERYPEVGWQRYGDWLAAQDTARFASIPAEKKARDRPRPPAR